MTYHLLPIANRLLHIHTYIHKLTLSLLFLLNLFIFPTITNGQILSDDFNDNTINSSLWIASLKGGGPTVIETNQRLEISFPTDSSNPVGGDTFWAVYDSVCKLRGDFDIQVDYSLLIWPNANGVRIGLSFGGVERVSRGAAESCPSCELYLTHFQDGVHGITVTSDLLGKLRLIRLGNTITGYYFSSGNWVPIHTGPSTTDDVSFALSAWSHDPVFADQEVKIAFDNFIINQGQLICLCQCSDNCPDKGCISGRIEKVSTGQPLPGRIVQLVKISPAGSGMQSMTVVTNDDGCYHFEGLADGTYRIKVKPCKGGGTKTVVITGGGKVNDVNFQCK